MRLNLIPEVFDPTTGCYIKAIKYFDEEDERQKDEVHAQRRKLLQAKRTGQKLWVCALCQEPIYIAGGLGRSRRRAHFKHFMDTPRCPYQTRGSLDKESIRKIKYNGAKESPLHRNMKESLAGILEKDSAVSGKVRVEKTVFSQDQGKEWRRPDIACSWNGLELVLEIQVSSDFLDVIVGREDFYRKHETFILWIFNRHDPDQYTTKDIYVGNQKNVFVFNERVKILSEETGILTFECYYKRPMLDQGKINDVWVCRDVTLRDLTFDRERMQAFWHDYDRAEREVQLEKLLADFEKYWCRERQGLNIEEADISARDRLYEIQFEKLCGIEPGWAKSQAAMVLDILYAIRNTSPEKAAQHVANYRINLFAAIDVMFNSRKPFLWAILWALDVYGHKKIFENRAAFKAKVDQYKVAKAAQDPAYHRETRYDPLFKLIFSQLAPKL